MGFPQPSDVAFISEVLGAVERAEQATAKSPRNFSVSGLTAELCEEFCRKHGDPELPNKQREYFRKILDTFETLAEEVLLAIEKFSGKVSLTNKGKEKLTSLKIAGS